MNDLDITLGKIGSVAVIGTFKGAKGTWRVTVGNDVYTGTGYGATFTAAAHAAVEDVRAQIAAAMGGVVEAGRP